MVCLLSVLVELLGSGCLVAVVCLHHLVSYNYMLLIAISEVWLGCLPRPDCCHCCFSNVIFVGMDRDGLVGLRFLFCLFRYWEAELGLGSAGGLYNSFFSQQLYGCMVGYYCQCVELGRASFELRGVDQTRSDRVRIVW
ncbi:hypothetical protein B0T25DRAFT_109261 [Lasiosphaeria hispida]|uniref:Uncharacterized protein n=1 Tax=Lasiosphaeria hispida TaxID=260671 RepID=A0AAJ0MI84_9PEZI|nr:hypothetical protein B0T25DRAFT_109261 [Lasiosphaeria hispida]